MSRLMRRARLLPFPIVLLVAAVSPAVAQKMGVSGPIGQLGIGTPTSGTDTWNVPETGARTTISRLWGRAFFGAAAINDADHWPSGGTTCLPFSCPIGFTSLDWLGQLGRSSINGGDGIGLPNSDDGDFAQVFILADPSSAAATVGGPYNALTIGVESLNSSDPASPRAFNAFSVNNPGVAPPGTTSITVTASPFTYTNATGSAQTVSVVGGTVSAVTVNAVAQSVGTIANYYVPAGQAIVVTYTVAPTMEWWPPAKAVSTWTGYLEGHRASAYAGTSFVQELEARNSVGATTGWNPYTTPGYGSVVTAMGCGAGLSATGQYNCSAAMYITANPKKFGVGLLFLDGSIAAGGIGGTKPAISMPFDQDIQWLINSTTLGARLTSDSVGDFFTVSTGFTAMSAGGSEQMRINTNGAAVRTTSQGTGNYALNVNGVMHSNSGVWLSDKDAIDANLNFYVGGATAAAIATSATGPFIYASTAAGAPTGVPAGAGAGQSAIKIDSTNHKICWYESVNTAWKCALGS